MTRKDQNVDSKDGCKDYTPRGTKTPGEFDYKLVERFPMINQNRKGRENMNLGKKVA